MVFVLKKRWSKSRFGCYNGVVRNCDTILCENDVVALAVGFTVCALVYVWLAFLLNLVSKDDIPHLPLKNFFGRCTEQSDFGSITMKLDDVLKGSYQRYIAADFCLRFFQQAHTAGDRRR